MSEKKNYVLWVVHTHIGTAIVAEWLPPLYIGEMQKLNERFKQLAEKAGYTKNFGELHREGVIKAMKIAQKAGMRIIYEYFEDDEKKASEFLNLAQKNGVTESSIVKIVYSPKTMKFFRKSIRAIDESGEYPEVIFVGHYIDQCIFIRAKYLQGLGFRPYLIIGTPIIHSLKKLKSFKEVMQLFGKNRLITLNQFEKLGKTL